MKYNKEDVYKSKVSVTFNYEAGSILVLSLFHRPVNLASGQSDILMMLFLSNAPAVQLQLTFIHDHLVVVRDTKLKILLVSLLTVGFSFC